MAVSKQEKGEKVQEKTGKVGGVRQKVGKFTDGRAKTRADESDFCEFCVREKVCRRMDGNGEKVGQSGGKVGANGGKGTEKGRKSAGKTGKVGSVRQKVGKFTDGRAKTPRRREGFL
ncbi:MAG: hypothetical protein IKM60_05275 [Clostridia bacterium]|nr:hypothetical protein [Clostridia bacterium]